MKILKKTLLPILMLGTILSVSACGKKGEEQPKEEIATAVFESVYTRSTFSLTVEELQEKMENKDDFVLLVSDRFCTACNEFKNLVLGDFISTYFVKIYDISVNELAKIGGTKNEIISYHTTPTLGTFVDGKLIDKVNYISSDNVTVSSAFQSVDGFVEYLKTPVNKEKRYIESGILIDEESATSLIESTQKSIIYYKRDTCGDCRFFYDNFLKEKAITPISDNADAVPIYSNVRFWVFDINEQYLARDPELGPEDPEWMAFTAKFGMSSLEYGGSAKGWKRGVVPYFQYRNDGTILDSTVIYNDDMEFATGSLTVTGSYYADSPYIGQTFSSYNEYQKQTLDYFVSKLDKFMIEYTTK